MAKAKTKQQLTVENEELRSRLQEMEDTLEAIRSGAVDAIVTSGPAGARVFTLEGADHAYHVMVETMNEGAVSLSTDGTILYGNRRFAQMAAASPSGIVGRRFHEFVHVFDHPILDTILDKAGLDCPTVEITLFSESAAEIPIQIAASPIEFGGAKALTLVITDLSAQRRYEEIVAAENLSRRILEQAQEAIAVCIDGCIVRANRALYEICEGFPLMQPFDLVFPLRISESEMFSIAMPESGNIIREQEVLYHRPDGRIFNLILNAGPLVGKDSKVLGTLITLVDVTARKRQAAVLDGISRIFEEAISNRAEEQLGEVCLAVAGELAASPIGFIGEIGEGGMLYDITISNPGWEACRMTEQGGHRMAPGAFKLHGLYGRVLREGKSFFTNDPSSEPDSIGLPPGHPPLASFLGVPLRREDRIIGMITVGNREGGYGQEELETLEALAPAIAEAFLRKRAEETLRDSEERLRFALDTSHTGAWDLDLVGHNAFRSLEHDRIFGYAALLPQWTYEMFLDHVLAEDRAAVDAKFRHATETQGDWSFECRIRRTDGEVRWIWAAGRHRADGTDAPRRMAGIVQDITERKLAEEALRERREDLDRAQAVGQIGSWRLDVQRNVLTWSDENHRIFGVPKGTPMSYETFLGTVHPDDRQYVDTRWKAGLAGEPYDIEHRIVADGQLKWVREKAYLEFDDAGMLRGGFGITQDITERKRAEEALRESEERLQEVLDSITDGYYVLDSEWRFVELNPVAARYFGYPAEELTGRNIWELRKMSPDSFVYQQFHRAVREDLPVHFEAQSRINPGTWSELHLYPREGRLDVYFRDITDRKQAETALKEANESLEQRVRERTMDLQNLTEQLERSRHNLRDLASELVMAEERERRRIAGVLHDEIAQTLAAARMRLDLLQGTAPDQQDQQTLKEAKALLVESVNETRALMMDIGNPVLYDMGLKAACEALTDRLMGRHPIRIRCDIRDAYKRLDPDVNTILFQLIRELLNNVVKHSHAQNAHVAIDLEKGHFRVKVTDDGVGFDSQTLGAPTIEGGFGLYSIRERLLAMDGSLSIESVPGTGTVVTAVLPAALT